MESTAVPRYSTSPHCGGNTNSTRPNNKYGWGRVDALAAVNAAINLPVELVSFTATPEGNTTLLEWATATERQCAFFEVQRSTDAVHWEISGKTPCSAWSNQLTDYRSTDTHPATGLNYYRLRQVDISGVYAYSPIVSVRHGAIGVRLRVAAHPAQQQAFVEVFGTATGERWQVSVHSMDGREVHPPTPLEQIQMLQLPALARGVYAVWLHDERGNVVDVQKMVW